MHRFDTKALAAISNQINGLADALVELRGNTGAGSPVPEAGLSIAREIVADAENIRDFPSLRSTASTVGRALSSANAGRALSFDSLWTHLEHLRVSLHKDLWDHPFILVRKDLSQLIDSEAPFGPEVNRAFPSAVYDLQEAGNCLAVGCFTAAVFHSMRAVEVGLRSLCKHFDISEVNGPHGESVKVEFLTWETLVGQIQAAITAKEGRMPKGEERQEFASYFRGLLLQAINFKEAYRNHVMHSRVNYNEDSANGILRDVERFMRELSISVTEGGLASPS